MFWSGQQKRLRGSGRFRGVTLIEAVLYIAIALALIVGGILFFQQASLAGRVNAQIRVISSIVAESRALFSTNDTLGALPDLAGTSLDQMVQMTGQRLESTLIAAGAVPASLVTSTAGPLFLRNEFDGAIIIAGGKNAQGQLSLVVVLSNVPSAACNRLSWVNQDGQGAVSDGIRAVGFSTTAGAVMYGIPGQDMSVGQNGGNRKCGMGPNVNLHYVMALK